MMPANPAANPIVTAVAVAVAARSLPVSGVRVTAPLSHGPALLSIAWAAMEDDTAEARAMGAPEGVSVSVLSRVPETVITLPALTDMDATAIAAAWAHGAWDVDRICHGPAGNDQDKDEPLSPMMPPMMAPIAAACRAQGYVSWYWRPMLAAPDIRINAWSDSKKIDVTLCPFAMTRSGLPMGLRPKPLRPGQAVTIRLGKRKPPEARATPKQRGYLGRLLAKLGRSTVLPRDLTLTDASDWIDRLRADLGQPPRPQTPRDTP